MDIVNTELAGNKLLFSLLLPESFYIYKLRFDPLATRKTVYAFHNRQHIHKHHVHPFTSMDENICM